MKNFKSLKSAVKSGVKFLTTLSLWIGWVGISLAAVIMMICIGVKMLDALVCGTAVGFVFLTVHDFIKMKPKIEKLIAVMGGFFALGFSLTICRVMPDPKSWVVTFNQLSGVITALAFAKFMYTADYGETRLKLGVAIVTFVSVILKAITAPGDFSLISAGRFIAVYGYGSLAVSLLVFYVWIWKAPMRLTVIPRSASVILDEAEFTPTDESEVCGEA